MQTKHTPGKWTTGTNAYMQPVVRDELARIVATCPFNPRTSDKRLGSPYRLDTAEANARLIAAAPALLQTLKDAREVLAVALAWPNSDKFRRQINNVIAAAEPTE